MQQKTAVFLGFVFSVVMEATSKMEAEQRLVAANRELIARFEKKIQATLARVWGEDAPADPVESATNVAATGDAVSA
jgi:hypothetical protein